MNARTTPERIAVTAAATTAAGTSATASSVDAPALSVAEIRSPAFLQRQRDALARDVARLHARPGEFVATPCPGCGGEASRPAFEKYGCRFRRCAGCATVYMSPRPSPALMADYYGASENYRLWAEHIFPASEASRRDKLCRPLLASILAACARHGVEPRHLVEVGPGFGTFAALALEERAFESVSAIERTPEMAEACRRRGIRVLERPIESLGGLDDPADVLVCFEVIEHAFDPLAFVSHARALLRPGGLMVLSCPNGDGFDTAMLGADSPAVDTEHVNLFNPASVRCLLERAGLEPLEVTTPGRLDVEIVREAALEGRLDLSDCPFLRRVLVDEHERLGVPFQRFLAEQGLSGHLRVVARRP